MHFNLNCLSVHKYFTYFFLLSHFKVKVLKVQETFFFSRLTNRKIKEKSDQRINAVVGLLIDTQKDIKL